MEELPLVVDIVVILAAALVGGIIARRLKLPAILGYLVGGIAIGPYAFGLVQDVETIETLANIGVIFLLFTLGVQFSLRQLRQIGRIAIFGGAAQILITAGLGLGLGRLLGWELTQALFFGFLIALSSTMILLKTLMDRGELDTPHGRIMIGILLVQDLSFVPMIIILPSLGEGGGNLALEFAFGTLKAGLFLGATLILGTRVVPWAMKRVAGLHSRELFILSVVTFSLGTAFGTYWAGLSLAFGAFVAGLLLSESDFGHQALADVIPLRDTFVILFFVSVGMLTDPSFMAQNASLLTIVVLAIVGIKLIVCGVIAWTFGYTFKTTLFVGLGMIQIGEFSFILARTGLNQGVISEFLYSLTLASAIITILLTPFALSLGSLLYQGMGRIQIMRRLLAARADPIPTGGKELSGHAVVCGHGRVGRNLTRVLERRDFPYLAIDLDPQVISSLRAKGIPCIYGDASNSDVLAHAQLPRARVLVITFPDPIAAELALRNALRINPRLDVVVRVHSKMDAETFREMGASELVRPEFEAGLEIIRHTLHRFGVSSPEIQHIVASLRERQ